VGEKTLAMLAHVFVFLFANPEFYSHLANWRVVIAPLVDPATGFRCSPQSESSNSPIMAKIL
jgi:hypothetical protein